VAQILKDNWSLLLKNCGKESPEWDFDMADKLKSMKNILYKT
jgi:hypothetical protein